MKKAELKDMWMDSEIYTPKNEDIHFWIDLRIGIKNENGADDFRLLVCTPEWLFQNFWIPKILRHTLIIRKYDLNEITKIINKYIEKCTGNDWIEIAEKLSRYFQWEFEDYDPCPIEEKQEKN